MMDLSIVIISYNTEKLLLSCLRSIADYTTCIKYEVIIVDNASSDGSQNIKDHAKFVKNLKVIKNKENLGFAKANNQGIKIAQGRYVLLLNSDTYLQENTLGKMVDWMDKYPEVGVTTCTLLNPDGSIQASGGSSPSLFKVLLWSSFLDDFPLVADIFGSYHPHTPSFITRSGYYKKDHEQDWVTGAFFFIRREVVEKVGYLDEDFFMYVEDLEYCFRIKECGWKIFYTTTASITHIGGASGTSSDAILGEYKSLRLFYSKHKNFIEKALLELFIKWGAILRVVLFSVINSKKGVRDAYRRALAAF